MFADAILENCPLARLRQLNLQGANINGVTNSAGQHLIRKPYSMIHIAISRFIADGFRNGLLYLLTAGAQLDSPRLKGHEQRVPICYTARHLHFRVYGLSRSDLAIEDSRTYEVMDLLFAYGVDPRTKCGRDSLEKVVRFRMIDDGDDYQALAEPFLDLINAARKRHPNLTGLTKANKSLQTEIRELAEQLDECKDSIEKE
jgi:hypothetical protein